MNTVIIVNSVYFVQSYLGKMFGCKRQNALYATTPPPPFTYDTYSYV